MPRPLVSVILPVYNNAATLPSAARSMLRQTVHDVELIIIDDGSTDDSYAVARSLRDPRIRLFRNERNLGVSKARNVGLQNMAGEFMAPMDADDVCPRDRLSRTLEVLRRDTSLGACGGWALWKGWGGLSYVGRLPWGPDAVRAYLLYGMPSPHDTLLFRTDVLREHELRYDEALRAAVDYDFYTRCAAVSGVDNVPTVLVEYRFNPHGISNTRAQEATARRLAGLRTELEKLFPEGVEEATLTRHAHVGNGAGAPDAAGLEASRSWLEAIERANAKRQVHAPEGLSLATAMVWFRVCRNSAHLGAVAWRAWRHSPWAAAYRPTRGERASLAGSWLLARLSSSRRKPQGALSGL